LFDITAALHTGSNERAKQLKTKAYNRHELRRAVSRDALLSISADGRLWGLPVGLGHSPEALLRVLLLRRMSVSFLATLKSHSSQSDGTACRRRGAVLHAEEMVVNINALLRRTLEHRLRPTSRYGRRPVWLLVTYLYLYSIIVILSISIVYFSRLVMDGYCGAWVLFLLQSCCIHVIDGMWWKMLKLVDCKKKGNWFEFGDECGVAYN